MECTGRQTPMCPKETKLADFSEFCAQADSIFGGRMAVHGSGWKQLGDRCAENAGGFAPELAGGRGCWSGICRGSMAGGVYSFSGGDSRKTGSFAGFYKPQ